MFIYIGGVPGVGKTKLIEAIKKRGSRDGIKIEEMVGVPILCDLTGVKTVEELRKLPEKERKKIRPKMYQIIYSRMKQKSDVLWIFDGHFCYFDWTGDSFSARSIQSWDKELMLGIVVLTAQPETILKRRMKDKRQDRKLDLNFIKDELKKEAEIAQLQAQKLRKPIKFIANKDGEIDLNAKKVLSVIKKWRGNN